MDISSQDPLDEKFRSCGFAGGYFVINRTFIMQHSIGKCYCSPAIDVVSKMPVIPAMRYNESVSQTVNNSGRTRSATVKLIVRILRNRVVAVGVYNF